MQSLMKTICVTILFFFVILHGFGQVANIPDGAFKNALMNSLCADYEGDFNYDGDVDTNNDNILQQSEVDKVRRLTLYNKNLTDITGINEFKNLTYLYLVGNKLYDLDMGVMPSLSVFIYHTGTLRSINLKGCENITEVVVYANALTELDLSNLKKLKIVLCEDNKLQTLDVSGCNALESLTCNRNKIKTLDLANKSNFRRLDCYTNMLKSLDLSSSQSLSQLIIYDNDIFSLYLPAAPSLSYLHAGNNPISVFEYSDFSSLKTLLLNGSQFAKLDVTTMTKLESLNLIGSKITEITGTLGLKSIKEIIWYNALVTHLDLSNSPLLTGIDIRSSKLVSLNLKNGALENSVVLTGCSQLAYICVDELQVNKVIKYVKSINLSSEVNSYCSFEPHESFYKIAGVTQFDETGNGCNQSDYGIAYPVFSISGQVNGTFYGLEDGKYQTAVQAGSYEVKPKLENNLFTVSPFKKQYTFNAASAHSVITDYCISPIAGIAKKADLEVYLTALNAARPGNNLTFLLTVKNNGSNASDGTIDMQFPNKYIALDSIKKGNENFPSGDVAVNNDLIMLQLKDIKPFTINESYVYFTLNKPTDSSPLEGGEVLEFKAHISPDLNDYYIPDNYHNVKIKVVNSLDPNNIVCAQGDTIKKEALKNPLTYTINFENKGSANAEHIMVKNKIDTAHLKLSTFNFINASHAVEVKILEGDRVEFIFKAIDLPFDTMSNKGYVTYNISPRENFSLGDTIKNQANIYFDYNFPIETNVSKVTLFEPTSLHESYQNEVMVYPNPTYDYLNLMVNENPIEFILYDANGRACPINITDTLLDIKYLTSGMYYIKVILKKGVYGCSFFKL